MIYVVAYLAMVLLTAQWVRRAMGDGRCPCRECIQKHRLAACAGIIWPVYLILVAYFSLTRQK